MHVITALSLSVWLLGCSARLTNQEPFDAEAFGAINLKPTARPRHIVGAPYFRNGRWYRPRHQSDYSATGFASWYGSDQTGRRTLNGERRDAQNLLAAHATLPLPSYVEVTNTTNGHVLTVRVNDRGPRNSPEIISVSRRAAEILGFNESGPTPVRVRFLSPAPIEHVGRDH